MDINNAIKDYEKTLKKKTYTINELSEVLGVSKEKARQLTHIKGFPCIKVGRNRLVIISKLDEWLEDNIGSELFQC